jgi:acetyl esterase
VTDLHPQVRSIVETAVTPLGAQGPADLEAKRAGYLQTALELGGAAETVAGVEDIVIPRADGGSLAARAYRPLVAAEASGALLWYHGGGWIIGDLEGFDRVARALANASGALCVTVDYRLAPEHPFPAAVDDARAAVDWAAGHGAGQLGFDAGRICVGGDSAGGALAAAAARHERERVCAQLLVYPALDARMDSPSYREFAETPMLSAAEVARCWAAYLDGHDGASDPDASPLVASDLAGAPPAYVAVADQDVLRDEGLAYVRALDAAGVDAEGQVFAGMVHGFLRWGGVVDAAQDLIAVLGERARRAIAR